MPSSGAVPQMAGPRSFRFHKHFFLSFSLLVPRGFPTEGLVESRQTAGTSFLVTDLGTHHCHLACYGFCSVYLIKTC